MINKTTSHWHRTLGAILEHADGVRAVLKAELRFGDRVLVMTRNSTYAIRVLENGFYGISGGWFDRKGLSQLKTTISGCTWGGSAIRVDIVAARGLHLEFGNRVVTSAIRDFDVIRSERERVHSDFGSPTSSR